MGIHWLPQLQSFFTSIRRAAWPLITLTIIALLISVPIATGFIQLFGGKFHECIYVNEKIPVEKQPDISNLTCFDFGGDIGVKDCAKENQCVGPNVTWAIPITMNFDDMGQALSSL